jgi:hypothetical protein
MLSPIETLVKKYGEQHRQLITESEAWLRQQEPKWNLDVPIDLHQFIESLLDKIHHKEK